MDDALHEISHCEDSSTPRGLNNNNNNNNNINNNNKREMI